MQIKKGDTVQVMKGKEAAAARGSEKRPRGKVIEILDAKQRIRVEGLRTVTKHLKRGRNPKHPEGGRIEQVGTIALANVQLVCPKCDKVTRIGVRKVDQGGDKGEKNKRFCRKCNELIDK
ncbi:MAG: 50S ribosomal protein L24 [Deltaproteobacteria bacterium]|nr:50S ribosomal protein L24 [Deltaproteobacteria bacterium]